jgi:hypothetical protein
MANPSFSLRIRDDYTGRWLYTSFTLTDEAVAYSRQLRQSMEPSAFERRFLDLSEARRLWVELRAAGFEPC